MCRGQISDTNTGISSAAITRQQQAKIFASWTRWRDLYRPVSTRGCPTTTASSLRGRQASVTEDTLAFDLEGVQGSLSDSASLCVSNQSFTMVPPTYRVSESELPQGEVGGFGGPGSRGSSGEDSNGAAALNWPVSSVVASALILVLGFACMIY